jgi:hypothetical protein
LDEFLGAAGPLVPELAWHARIAAMTIGEFALI